MSGSIENMLGLGTRMHVFIYNNFFYLLFVYLFIYLKTVSQVVQSGLRLCSWDDLKVLVLLPPRPVLGLQV